MAIRFTRKRVAEHYFIEANGEAPESDRWRWRLIQPSSDPRKPPTVFVVGECLLLDTATGPEMRIAHNMGTFPSGTRREVYAALASLTVEILVPKRSW